MNNAWSILIGCVVLLGLILFSRLYFSWIMKIGKAEIAEQERKERLALELHPAYRQKVAEDRQYELAKGQQVIEWERFALERYLSVTRAKPEQYLLDYVPDNITALPSLKRGQPETTVTPVDETTDYLPGTYTFSGVLQDWTPTKDGILLAKKQELITVPIGEALCHTTFTGPTDGNKTNNQRLLLVQLIYLGQMVYLCDWSYQRYRRDKKLNCVYDYSPIEKRLAHPPVSDSREALALIQQLVSEVDNRRIQKRKALVSFPDVYLVMDELPAFCEEEPAIMTYLGKLLRTARQHGVFFVGAAQDLLNTTLKNDNGAVRDNLLTNFYSGGDSTTARLVLNLAKGETIDETGLGKQGVVYLRAKGADIERVKARTPLVDNASIQMLLGRPDVVDADFSPVETFSPDVQTFAQSPLTQPRETAEATSSERLKRLDVEESQQFIIAYKVSGSIDKSLSAIGKGSAYRAHARELVSAHNLRREA